MCIINIIKHLIVKLTQLFESNCVLCEITSSNFSL